MAFYESYYSPVGISCPAGKPSGIDRELDAHPLTWVPLVFHCTDSQAFSKIVKTGFIKPKKGCVSLTEMSILELDRMKEKRKGKIQVAIGFPRSFVQQLGFAPVLATKHHPDLKRIMSKHPKIAKALHPYVVTDDDLSAFHEIRTTSPIPIEEAVWILRSGESEKKDSLFENSLDTFRSKYGMISKSKWHRTHQLEILSEWQFLKFERDANEAVTDFDFRGEHYWKSECFTTVEKTISMPAGNDWQYQFQRATPEHSEWDGPYHFFDVATELRKVIRGLYPSESEKLLEYALIQNLDE